MTKYLFIGGQANGTYIDVPEDLRSYKVITLKQMPVGHYSNLDTLATRRYITEIYDMRKLGDPITETVKKIFVLNHMSDVVVTSLLHDYLLKRFINE
jgi:hypothetical protein